MHGLAHSLDSSQYSRNMDWKLVRYILFIFIDSKENVEGSDVFDDRWKENIVSIITTFKLILKQVDRYNQLEQEQIEIENNKDEVSLL